MKKIIPIFLILITTICCFENYAQDNYQTFKDSMNHKLEILTNFSSTLYDPELESFDPDSLSTSIVEDLTNYLRTESFRNFNIADFPLIEFPLSVEGPFEVFVVGYHCGGTAGWIPRSIIIKHTGDKPLIYPIDAECYFYEFHRLRDELYLCIGGSPGSGICRGYSIYAIDFSKDEARFEPVLDKNNSFHICNSDIIYDEDNNMLVIDVEHLPNISEESNYEKELSDLGYSCFSVIYNSENQKDENLTLKSRFDGNKFVKPE